MLANIAARALSGRGTPSAFRIAVSTVASRSLCSTTTSSRPLSKSTSQLVNGLHSSLLPGSVLASTRRTFASGPSQPPNNRDDERRGPAQNTPPQQPQESSDPSGQFKSKLRQENESNASDQGPVDATGQPLPDLRQGIPSMFDSSSSSEASKESTAKESDPLELHLSQQPDEGSGGRRDDEGQREYVSSIERRRNAWARRFYIAAAIGSLAGTLYLGRNWSTDTEANSHPDAPNGFTPAAMYSRCKERLGMIVEPYTEPAFQKLLPDPPADPNLRAPYTLLLSLEDLLVCSKWDRSNGYTIAKRPGVDYFLRYMSQYYELVIFTTVPQMNADAVLRKLDPFHFCLPLTREATRYMDGEHVKDLSYLNRDLSKTIIIDTVPGHVKLQPENAIILPKWKGDPKDPGRSDLVALIPFLEYIASMSISDVRKVLQSYEGTHIPTEFHERENKAREEFHKRLAEEKSKRGRFGSGGGLKSLSSALGFKPPQTMIMPGEQSPIEGLAEGKMLTDQMRERGQRAYMDMEKQIRENGEMWLKQQAEEEKKMQDEAAKSMTSWFSFFGGGAGGDKKDASKGEESKR